MALPSRQIYTLAFLQLCLERGGRPEYVAFMVLSGSLLSPLTNTTSFFIYQSPTEGNQENLKNCKENKELLVLGSIMADVWIGFMVVFLGYLHSNILGLNHIYWYVILFP